MSKKPWEILETCKATYYNHLKKHPHGSLIEQYIEWKSQAIFEREWSNGYLRRSIYQLRKYLAVYPIVNPKALAVWIAEVPPERFSNRKDRHAAVSNFAKYLLSRGLLSNEAYAAIRSLYPKKSRYYKPKQKIISDSNLAELLAMAEMMPEVHTSMVFLSESGLRLAEYCMLQRADLYFSDDPTQAKILVRMGKGGKTRWVPFSRRGQDAVRGVWSPPSTKPQLN